MVGKCKPGGHVVTSLRGQCHELWSFRILSYPFLYHMSRPSIPLIDLSVLIMPCWHLGVFLNDALVLRLCFCCMVDGGEVTLCGHCDLQVKTLMS